MVEQLYIGQLSMGELKLLNCFSQVKQVCVQQNTVEVVDDVAIYYILIQTTRVPSSGHEYH